LFIDEIEVGMARSLSRVISDAEIESFADASGDRNPLHFCDDHASGTVFKGRIAHGILTASLISAVIGEQMPGHGAIYLSQTLRFRAPVRPGDEVIATCTVRDVDPVKKRLTLDCTCMVGDTIVLDGEATVLAPARPVAVMPVETVVATAAIAAE
jgi:3-hydroxybutyryl-CoA dehydratase